MSLQTAILKNQGKHYSLNGKEDNFLTVTDKEGKSLLTDVTELTVSYDAKTERSDTNWIMYAAPNKNNTTIPIRKIYWHYGKKWNDYS